MFYSNRKCLRAVAFATALSILFVPVSTVSAVGGDEKIVPATTDVGEMKSSSVGIDAEFEKERDTADAGHSTVVSGDGPGEESNSNGGGGIVSGTGDNANDDEVSSGRHSVVGGSAITNESDSVRDGDDGKSVLKSIVKIFIAVFLLTFVITKVIRGGGRFGR